MTAVLPTLTKLVKTARGVLYPQTCFNCNAFISFEPTVNVCRVCERKIALTCLPSAPFKSQDQPHLDECYSLFRYKGVAKKLIYKFKISRAFYVIPVIEHFLDPFLKNMTTSFSAYDALVPLPSHHPGTFQLNQSASSSLAHLVSGLTKKPLLPLVGRTHRIPKQSSLPRSARLVNPLGSLKVSKKSSSLPASVLLVDDVITTGATANTAAEVLKKHGVRQVAVFTLARG